MAYRMHGRARVNASHPEAFATCDRCQFLYNRVSLVYQMEWSGPTMINRRVLVCKPCLDIPQEQLRTIFISADPDPVIDPRLDRYNVDGGVAFPGDIGVAPTPPPVVIPPPPVTGQSARLNFSKKTNSQYLAMGL